jgi:hypothetical protein
MNTLLIYSVWRQTILLVKGKALLLNGLTIVARYTQKVLKGF